MAEQKKATKKKAVPVLKFSIADLLFQQGQISKKVYEDSKAGKYKTIGEMVNSPDNGPAILRQGDAVAKIKI
jgi:hypothetical protein